jgi:hypothetical protein
MTCDPFSRQLSRSCSRLAACALAVACLGFYGCAAPTATPPKSTDASAATVACTPAPIAGPLFLRGAMTNWALDDDYTFQYQCDAYVLNVNLTGTLGFRITDAASSPLATFGGPPRETASLASFSVPSAAM